MFSGFLIHIFFNVEKLIEGITFTLDLLGKTVDLGKSFLIRRYNTGSCRFIRTGGEAVMDGLHNENFW